MRYQLAKHTISRDDLDALADWLRGNPRLTQGELVHQFEVEWAKWLGVKYAVMCNSGSSANLLIWAAVKERLGHCDCIAPALCWPTTVAPAMQLELGTPRLVDADVQTWGMSADGLEELFRDDSVGHASLPVVIVVHMLGVPCDMTRIMGLQAKHGFTLLEDACGAHGSRVEWKTIDETREDERGNLLITKAHRSPRKVGTFGAMSSFSFYYGHAMSCIEGGIICTNDQGYYHLLLMLREHGWRAGFKERGIVIVPNPDEDSFRAKFTFHVAGFNMRSTDLNAFIALRQLRNLDSVVKIRHENDTTYRLELAGIVGMQQPRGYAATIGVGCVAENRAQRDRIVAALTANGIETRPIGTGNLTRQPMWMKRFRRSSKMPVADAIHDFGFQLPNNQAMLRRDVEDICEVVKAGAA